MKITSTSLLVIFEKAVSVNGIDGKLTVQANIMPNTSDFNVGPKVYLDEIDFTDVKVFGSSVEMGCESWDKFVLGMESVGINVDELISKEFATFKNEIYKSDEIEMMKRMVAKL